MSELLCELTTHDADDDDVDDDADDDDVDDGDHGVFFAHPFHQEQRDDTRSGIHLDVSPMTPYTPRLRGCNTPYALRHRRCSSE